MKDDSGTYAVFTEQSSSESQMTAAKVMDVIARLPDCDGQAADAISACIQVKWRMLQDRSKIQRQHVQIYGYVFQDTNGRNRKKILKTPLFLLRHTYTDTHLLAYCGRGNSKKKCWNFNGKQYRMGNVCLFKEYSNFLSVWTLFFNGWKQAELGSYLEEIDEKR